MEKTYRLKFNEKQQNFHLDNYTHEANTHGWVTITDHCSDMEFHIFEAYINRVKVGKFKPEHLIKSISEIKQFIINLSEYNLTITKL